MNFVPTSKDYWRALILYGRNASTYKMGLGRLLIDYAGDNREKIPLDDVARDFLNLYLDRTKNGQPQLGRIGRKTYVEHEVDAIRVGKNLEESIGIIKNNALLGMVLQKFHTLYDQPVPKPFYEITEGGRYLVLTDDLRTIFSTNETKNELLPELNSRWDLLEFAFSDGRKSEYLDVDTYLEKIIRKEKRTTLTQLIPTLQGYQQNRCFYCGEQLYDIAVDHLIPYQAVMHNDVWNLVLAHDWCNAQKSDNLPPKHFIENLIARNEYFISSSHPIKDTLIKQLGTTPQKRREKVQKEYIFAKGKIVRIWGGNDKYDPKEDKFYRNWVKVLGQKIQ